MKHYRIYLRRVADIIDDMRHFYCIYSKYFIILQRLNCLHRKAMVLLLVSRMAKAGTGNPRLRTH